MFCPEYRILHIGPLSVWLYASCDTQWKLVPKKQKYNPLRYQLTWARKHPKPYFIINRHGRAHVRVSDFMFNLKARLGIVPPLRR